MKKFASLSNLPTNEVEKGIREKWLKEDIFK